MATLSWNICILVICLVYHSIHCILLICLVGKNLRIWEMGELSFAACILCLRVIVSARCRAAIIILVSSPKQGKSLRYKKFGAQFCISASVPVVESGYHHISGVRCPPTQRQKGARKNLPSVRPYDNLKISLPAHTHPILLLKLENLEREGTVNLQWDLSWDDNYGWPGNCLGKIYTDWQLALAGARAETQLCLAQ